MAQTKKSGAHGFRQTRWLAALGMLFVLGSFALLLRDAFVGGRPVAEIRVRVDGILPSSDGYVVSLTIQNAGTATAKALVVEGVLSGAKVETSTVTVDYVAAGSKRYAALFFSKDPRQGELTVRPKGYIQP